MHKKVLGKPRFDKIRNEEIENEVRMLAIRMLIANSRLSFLAKFSCSVTSQMVNDLCFVSACRCFIGARARQVWVSRLEGDIEWLRSHSSMGEIFKLGRIVGEYG